MKTNVINLVAPPFPYPAGDYWHYLSAPQRTLPYHPPSRIQSVSWNMHGKDVRLYWETDTYHSTPTQNNSIRYRRKHILANACTFVDFCFYFDKSVQQTLQYQYSSQGSKRFVYINQVKTDSSWCSISSDILLNWKIGCIVVILCIPEVHNWTVSCWRWETISVTELIL